MSTAVISQRYAKALMNLAIKADRLEEVILGLDDIADSLIASPELSTFFSDAKVPQSVKKETVSTILAKVSPDPLVDSFLRFVTGKRRINLLDEIRVIFHRLADERQGRAQAEITVASQLSGDQEKGFQQKLETLSGKQITLNIKVDPEIIGGAITRIGSEVWDGSLRRQLNNIHKSITEG